MANETSNPSIDHLLAHAGWLSRLAHQLLRDDSEADDATQETWAAVQRHPPERDRPARPWLAEVLRNVVRMRARARGRRHRWEQLAASEVLGRTAPGQESVAERVETHQLLVGAVLRLEEPFRTTVLLRYFEDRSAVEIARVTAEPPGTVRWRLKTALDQLRRELDQKFDGERGRWVRLLAPLVPPRAARRVSGVGAGWLAGTTLAVIAAAIGLHRRIDDPATHTYPVEARNTPRPGHPAPAIAPNVAGVAGPCPESAELDREIVIRERELADRDRPDAIFARSTPNPIAQEKFSALAERAFKCSYAVECRGRICQVRLLVPEGRFALLGCTSHQEGSERGIPRRYLGRPGTMYKASSPTLDVASGESLQRVEMLFSLANPRMEPVEVEDRSRLPPLRPGRHRMRRPLPADRGAGCRAQVSRLGDKLAALEDRVDDVTHLQDVFTSSDPNPGLVAGARRELARLLGATPAALPLEVQCRGPVCAATPVSETEPTVARWLDWWRVLDRERRQSAMFERIEPHTDDLALFLGGHPGVPISPGPIYVRVRGDQDRAKADPVVVIREFLRRVDSAAVFARCKQSHVGMGALNVQLRIEKGERALALESGGAALATPLGVCIMEELRALAASTEVPDTRDGLVWTLSPFLPMARSLDDRPGPWR
jgi:RNA polymerase sigma factor (sigma-70 family)